MSYLILQRRFYSLFFTQFLGALNDNVFKNTVVMAIAYNNNQKVQMNLLSQSQAALDNGMFTSIAAGLFILPYAICSPLAGQLSDKYDKAFVMRISKLSEVIVMAIACLGFYFNNIALQMLSVLLMGTQSAFFGPAKYGIIPQHLKKNELTFGNSLISMSTFTAIILGLVLASYFVDSNLMNVVPFALLGIAIMGYLTSMLIPDAPSLTKDLVLDYRILKVYKDLRRYAKKNHSVYISILSTSWLWFIGSIIVTQMINYAQFAVGGGVAFSAFLTLCFIIGIVIGSFLCIYFSKGGIEVGLVPIGAIGMSIFGIDLYFIDYIMPLHPISIINFLYVETTFSYWRILFDLTGIGVFASLFIIPLNTLIQHRAKEEVRSRIISYNNMVNALFMVTASLLIMLLYKLGLRVHEIFLLLFISNLIICSYFFRQVPEFTKATKKLFWGK